MKTLSALLIAGLAMASAVAGSARATSQQHNSSHSNVKPALLPPPAGAPASCLAAARQLDGNGDRRIDEDILSGRRKPDMTPAQRCIDAGDGPWGHYLKGRTLAAVGRYAEAAAEASQAEAAIGKWCPPNCRDRPDPRVGPGGYPPPALADVRLFRANALVDAGRR